MTQASETVPGTDTPRFEVVADFLDGVPVQDIAARVGVPVAVIELVLRSELRVLLWLHGKQSREGAPPDVVDPPPSPVPAPPAAPAPATPPPSPPPRPAPSPPAPRPAPTRPGGPWTPGGPLPRIPRDFPSPADRLPRVPATPWVGPDRPRRSGPIWGGPRIGDHPDQPKIICAVAPTEDELTPGRSARREEIRSMLADAHKRAARAGWPG